jgi:hypothetical protein
MAASNYMSRKEAKQRGHLYYATGKPCLRNHVALRQTSSGGCTECVKLTKAASDAKYRAENLEKIQAHDRARGKVHNATHRKNNPETVRKMKSRYYEKYKHVLGPQFAEYRAANKARLSAYFAKYKQSNVAKVNAIAAKRRSAKLRRTPAWLTEDDLWIIEQAYELAALRTRLFGVPWHVDHVLPLQGKTVSGLHVPTNLQVIFGVENARKGNRV